jgi:hypothetical protein
MGRQKLSDENRKIMLEVWYSCPCVSKATLARIFNISQCRVGEIIREENAEVRQWPR